MENTLIRYFDSRLGNETPKVRSAGAGPVINISREVGCNAVKLARLLAQKFSNNGKNEKWNVLSKEFFYESARALKLNPDEVQKVFKQPEKYTFDEVLKAFSSKHYVSERKIVKTVVNVIRDFAVDGHCIIVGRGGHVISKDIHKSLNIRLFAPMEYRIGNIMVNNSLSHDAAKDFIQKVEIERIAFRKAIKEESIHDELFDLYLNRANLDEETIAEIIELAAVKKGLFD